MNGVKEDEPCGRRGRGVTISYHLFLAKFLLRKIKLSQKSYYACPIKIINILLRISKFVFYFYPFHFFFYLRTVTFPNIFLCQDNVIFQYTLLACLRWSVDCDDDGSLSSSALVCSHVALKSDAGQANPATGRAGKCLPFWCHVLVLALMAS